MLAAADALLIPLQCEYYALEGLSQLLNTVHLIQHSVNPSLGICGVLLTMYDARLNLSRQVAADAREYFGAQVFDTVVPRNVRLAEAPSFGKPIVLYDVQSIGAQAYIAVADELMRARGSGTEARLHADITAPNASASEAIRMSADTPRRLGRGLEALISTAKQQREPAASPPCRCDAPAGRSANSSDRRHFSRTTFSRDAAFTEPELAELEASIRASGLLAAHRRPCAGGGKWELVAGERRLRAVTRLGWTEIPAVVRDFDDRAMLTLALVENLQRADLNPLEEAEGYQRLIDEFGLTQQQVADAVGKDRTTITNLLRVLTLPAAVRQMVESGHITAGHARALLPIKDERRQSDLANEIVARQLSVREVEARARTVTPAPGRRDDRDRRTDRPSAAQQRATDPAVRRIEEQLRKRLQTDVQVQALGNDRGVVRISFYSADDLERLLDLIVGPARSDFD